VTNAGTIRLKKRLLFLSNALQQHPVGLEEVDDGIWSIHFCHVLLGRVDVRSGHIVGREIAADHPPANPVRAPLALYGPYRHVWRDVPGWQLTNAPVVDAFASKIDRDLGTTRLTPLLFHCRVVVIGHLRLATILPNHIAPRDLLQTV